MSFWRKTIEYLREQPLKQGIPPRGIPCDVSSYVVKATRPIKAVRPMKSSLAQHYLYGMLACAENRDDVARNGLAVYGECLHALADVARILDGDVVDCTAELTNRREAVPLRRDRRIYLQAVEVGHDTENVLGDGYHVPCSGTGQPGVLALTEVLAGTSDVGAGILAADHLAVNIRLGLMDIAGLLGKGRCDFGVVLECEVALSCVSSCTDDPCIVVREDTGVLLVAARVGGNLTVLDVVLGVCGIVEHKAELRVESLVDCGEGLYIGALLLAHVGHDGEALRLDEDLAFLAILGAHLLAVGVVCTKEPVTVPCGIHDGLLHGVDGVLRSLCLIVLAEVLENCNIVRTGVGEEGCNHDGLGNLGVAALCSELRVRVGLEALARRVGVAGEVDAVVPVGAHRKRKLVRAEVVNDVIEGNLQVLEHGLCLAHIVVVRDHLIKDGPVAGLLDVSGNGKNQPQRVVGEVTADVGVALLGEGLVLMVASAVRELRGGDIDDTLLRAVRNLMHETEDVLVGIAEAHAAADAGFEVRRGARQVEGNHALILVPDIDHAVNLVVGRLNIQDSEKLVPGGAKLCHACGNLLRSVVFLHHGKRLGLVDGLAVSLKLLVRRHLNVAEDEDKGLRLAGSKGNLLKMRSNRSPAVGEGVVRLTCENRLRIAETVVKTDEGIAVGIVAVDVGIYRVKCEMIAAVTVLGLVVNRGAYNLNTSGGEVALEVVAVVLSVPEAPLSEREETEGFGGRALVGQNELLNLTVVALGHEEGSLGLQAVLLAGDDRVAHTVAAFVAVQLGLNRGPAGVPHGIAVLDVEIATAHINRNIVVTITGDAAQAGVLIERIAAGGVGNQREKAFHSQIVDPGIRSFRGSDDVLSAGVIKITVLHQRSSFEIMKMSHKSVPSD